MKEFSNNQLIIIAVIAIVVSLFSIFISFGGKLSITGMIGGTNGIGYVNVTVPSTAAITVWITSINFTGTNPGASKTSYAQADVDSTEGLPCETDNHCGMNITNDGSSFINITLYESERLFDSGSYDNRTHFLYNVTMQDPDYGTATYGANGNCSVGYDRGLPGIDGTTTGQWRPVPDNILTKEDAVCYLNNTDTLGTICTASHTGNTDVCPDIARIEFNITVPDDEPAGDKAGTLTFTAVGA